MELKGKPLIYTMALTVIFIWGVTFISTKILLRCLTPAEILIYRYAIAYVLFVAMEPKLLWPRSWRDEFTFAVAGFLGITLYFLCENFALSYSFASNVAMLVTVSPMLTGILAHYFTNGEKMTRNFAFGCVFGLTGVFLLVFNGHFILKLNPAGDLLAICAAMSFAVYSIVIKNIDREHYTAVQITRKCFFYALLTLAPLAFTPLTRFEVAPLMRPEILANIAFLGVFASAGCFLMWSKVIWELGATKANNLVYLIPPITMAMSAIVLYERITVFAVVGGMLILIGVYVSQKQS